MTINSRIIQNIVVAISAVAAIACLIVFVISMFFAYPLISAFFFFYTAVYGGIYFFARLGFNKTSSIALFFAIDTGILGLSSMVGPNAQFDIMFLLLMAFPFLLFEAKQMPLRLTTSLVPFFSFLVIQASDHALLPRQDLSEYFTLFISLSLNACAFLSAGVLFYYFSVNRDERLKLNKQINQQTRKYEKLDKAWKESARLSAEKTQFIMTIGHEFRTPVTGIIGNIELIDDENIDEQNQSQWQLLKQSAYYLNELLIDVLDFTQLEQGLVELTPEPCYLDVLIEQAGGRFQKVAMEKGIHLNYQVADSCNGQFVFDHHKVNRVLVHLISNAVKFTNGPRGEVSIRADINRLGQIQILVRDTGIGIAPEKIATIFDSFTQGESDLNRRYGGNGLGLFLSWHLAQALKGQLRVTSEEGVGSNFIFTFEAEKAKVANLHIDTQQVEDISQYDALIVEDNPVNQKVLKSMLQRIGISSEVAENGLQALEILKQKDFDLIFMDLQMPIMDGLETCRRYRELEVARNKHRTPVLTISANATKTDQEAAIEAGMDDFLAKPFRLQQLSDKISQLTRLH